MREIVRLTGVCLIGLAAGTYLQSVTTGLCMMLFLLGAGLVIDSLKK